MQRLLLVALLALGCGETTASGGGMTPEELDQACREFCANDQQGPDCGPEGNDSVQNCYESCIDGYSRQVTPGCPEGFLCDQGPKCPDEWWAANYGCYLSVDCNDQFGDCDGLDAGFEACIEAYVEDTPAWCEANCPEDEACVRGAAISGIRGCEVVLP